MGNAQFKELIEASELQSVGRSFSVEHQKLKSKDAGGYLCKLVEQLPHLELLEAKDCNLKALPPEIKKCQGLLTLRLTGNALNSLPLEFPYVSYGLYELNVSRNAFTEFPDALLQ